MIKALFMAFQPIIPDDGISRKIENECKALRSNGFDISLGYIGESDGHYRFQIDGKGIEDYGTSPTFWKIGCRLRWRKTARAIIDGGYKFIYVRYTHFASPWTVRLFRYLHRHGCRVFLEIPTYPYDSEYVGRKGFADNIAIAMERRWRGRMARYLSRIVTFSADRNIWGCPTVRIGNGVNIGDITARPHKELSAGEFRMIGVAAFSEWHGYDRLLRGIAEYKRTAGPSAPRVHLELVGPHNPVCARLMELADELGLGEEVAFPGAMSGSGLDRRFAEADIAIGSLGRHRSGITEIRTLKNREYAARGIPFVYSECDPDFDDKRYVLRVAADESPVDIGALIAFCHKGDYDLSSARRFVTDELTWDSQMRIVREAYDEVAEENR